MKKIFFTATVFFCCLFTGFTGHTQITRCVPEEVRLAYDINFNEASLVSWEKVRDGYRAIVNLGKERIDAYFSKTGEFKGVGRCIESNLLSVKVIKKLSRQYDDFSVEEIYEYTCNVNGICYFITMQNDQVMLVVKFSPSGKLLDSEEQQIKKPDNIIVRKE